MSNLPYRQFLLQEKRKKTEWREFVMEICSWYNIGLYKNNGLISRYPNEERNKNIIVDLNISMNCELEGNLGLGFMEGFTDLYSRSSKSRILNFGINENCDFTDSCYGAKNCYLSFGLGWGVEDSLYSFFVAQNCSNIINTMSATYNSSYVYFGKSVKSSFNIFYSANIVGSNNIWFSSNLISCSECLFCDNLINQSYYIKNKSYPKEEYFMLKLQYLSQKDEFIERHADVIQKLGNTNSKNVTGKGITHSDNIENGYIVSDTHKARNVVLLEGGEMGCAEIYDGIDVGIDSNDFYALCQAGTNSNNLYCGVFIGMSSYCFYCMNLDSCSYCLGCIGLKNKSYCILNKQYSKEERYIKVDEIFGNMYEEGILGNFFPAGMNPFYFNDTAAYLIDPTFTKEEVTAKGYLRRDEPIKVDIPEGALVVKTSELGKFEGFTNLSSGAIAKDPGDGDLDFSSLRSSEGQQWYIDPSILKYIIQDEQGNVYRIVKMEYDFLMKYGLPLPRKHRLDRMKENFRIN